MFIIKKLQEFRRKKILKNIRKSLKDFGYDLSDISDEVIESSIITVAKGLGQCGVSCADAVRALTNIIKAKAK